MSVGKYYTVKYEMIFKIGSKVLVYSFLGLLSLRSFNVKLANTSQEWICVSQMIINDRSRFALNVPV